VKPTPADRAAEHVRGFWRGLSDGLTLQELWAQFRRESGASYRLYTREVGDPARADATPRDRLRFAGALFRALVMKLSPPRRVFLMLALLLVVLGVDPERRLYGLLGALGLLALLGLELADRVALKRDLEIARDIQRWLVPQAPPADAGADIAFRTRPANTVAGDYYDAFRCPAAAGGGTRLVLVVADVAGKGMPAALLMAAFQSSLRTLVQEALPLAELVSRLNRYTCEHSLDGLRFTTAFIAEMDTASGALDYVNAGHNPPALRRAAGGLEWLETGGVPLGILRDARYDDGQVTLAAGDELVVYTDGVVEAQDWQGHEYGQDRLAALLGGLRTTGAGETLERLMAAVDAHIGDAGRTADTTCLVVRRPRA
jgi:serine phosphatase RsbU (regulator of sigma subunit)